MDKSEQRLNVTHSYHLYSYSRTKLPPHLQNNEYILASIQVLWG